MRKSIIEICLEINLPLRTLPAGEAFIEEGVRQGNLYILNQGTVEISKGGVELTDVSTQGAVFGEVSQLMNTAPMATVKTVKESSF
ncbi:MAG: cyclic nucleotide-binding domain-containing protein, partial [Verrucomicrobiales bacterium]